MRTILLLALALPLYAQSPCSLLTKAQVAEALGAASTDPKPNATNPSVCDYKVGPAGSFGVALQPVRPGQGPDQVMAASAKANLKPVPVPGLGDKSFFLSPGYGMIQLNSFKGKSYVILTVLVPGATPDKQKAALEKLMKLALAKL